MPSPRQIRAELERLDLRPSKSRGQNFLLNERIARDMADACRAGSVLEIGPGLGSLTRYLVEVSDRLCCIEISSALCGYLQGREDLSSAAVVEGDFLEADPEALPGYPFDLIAANLPYSISSQALLRLLEKGFESIGRAVVMLQREVAERASCIDGGTDYGRLSLQLWPVFRLSALLDAGADDFYPPPAVRSRVLILERRPEPLVPADMFEPYREMVRASFRHRRKTILNNLSSIYPREEARKILDRAGMDHNLRAEQIPPSGFLRLAEAAAP